MFCKNCGKEMENGQKFCSACGAGTSNKTNSSGMLKLKRSFSMADMACAYKIIIDGNEVSEIKQGKEYSCPLPYGTHTLQIKFQFCTSKCVTFTIDDTKTYVHFECYTIFKGMLAIFTGFLMKNQYITLKRI